jgi:hypothetical protein
MDALSDVLRVAHLTGGVFLHADFFAPWCMAARVAPEHCAPALGPASHLILYHYVVEGELRIRVDGEDGEELVLGAGDVVLLPRNDLHLVGSDLTLPPVAGINIIQPPKDGGLFSINHGGTGKLTRMICGFLGCDCAEDNPVISTLPSLLKLDAEQGGQQNGSARPSNMLPRRSPLAAQVRRPCWRSCQSCCSLKPCGATLKHCRRGRPVGSQVCATPTLRGRWRCYITTLPGLGTWMTSAVRSACRVRRWPTASLV